MRSIATFAAIYVRISLTSMATANTIALREFCRRNDLTWRRDLAVLLHDAWVSVTETCPSKDFLLASR